MQHETVQSPPRRVVIVGAGAIGLCTALALRGEGHEVTLLDRNTPGMGASFGNACVLATESVVPVATPGIVLRVPGMLLDPLGPLSLRWRYLPRLLPWLWRFLAASRPHRVEEIARALAALLHGSVEAWRPLLARAGAGEMLVQRGWIGVHADRRGLAHGRRTAALQRRLGVEVEEMDVPALRQMEPALSRNLAGGFYYPGVAHVVDSFRLMEALAEALRREGGRIECAEVRGFRHGPAGVTAVETDRGPYDCATVVLAAGAWSRPLASALGAPVPLDTERGYHLQLPDPGILLSRPVYASDWGIACTPLGDGLRLAGTVEFAGLAAPPNWRRAEVFARRARRLFPDLSSHGAGRWMGFRPSLPDSLPIIGPSPQAPNAFLAFGHGHLGLTLAARTAALIADMIAGRQPPVDPAPYRPGRF